MVQLIFASVAIILLVSAGINSIVYLTSPTTDKYFAWLLSVTVTILYCAALYSVWNNI